MKIIELDLTGCKTLGELHERIRVAFDFPEWYGKNWDAFHDFYGANWDALWDLLQDVFSDDEEYLVEIYNLNKMNSALRNSCEKMLEVFEDLHNINPNFKFTIVGD